MRQRQSEGVVKVRRSKRDGVVKVTQKAKERQRCEGETKTE